MTLAQAEQEILWAAFAELAEAILRANYSKDLHNIGVLEALTSGNFVEFVRAYRERHDWPSWPNERDGLAVAIVDCARHGAVIEGMGRLSCGCAR